jgi:hypothetical protein
MFFKIPADSLFVGRAKPDELFSGCGYSTTWAGLSSIVYVMTMSHQHRTLTRLNSVRDKDPR